MAEVNKVPLPGWAGRVYQPSFMRVLSEILVALVALLHCYLLVLEMFLWTKPYGRRVFNLTPEKAEATRTLAAKDRKSTRLNSNHSEISRMPSSA